jgi:hypothetical protein
MASDCWDAVNGAKKGIRYFSVRESDVFIDSACCLKKKRVPASLEDVHTSQITDKDATKVVHQNVVWREALTDLWNLNNKSQTQLFGFP